MRVTRSVGKGRKASSNPSTEPTESSSEYTEETATEESSESGASGSGTSSTEHPTAPPVDTTMSMTAATSATNTSASDTCATNTSATNTSATDTSATNTSATNASATSASTSATNTVTATIATVKTVTATTTATTATETATGQIEDGRIAQKRPIVASSHGSRRSKQNKIARAREEVLRLQLELATARLARITAESEDEEEEEDVLSDATAVNVDKRVEYWWDSQTHLNRQRTEDPQQQTEDSQQQQQFEEPRHPSTMLPPPQQKIEPQQHSATIMPPPRVEEPQYWAMVVPPLQQEVEQPQHPAIILPPPNQQNIARQPQRAIEMPPPHLQQILPRPATQLPPWQPAVQHQEVTAQSDIKTLAEAITTAVKATQQPKYSELPIFNGSHQDWLTFLASYNETARNYSSGENMSRLRRSLKGKAKEAVNGLLITSGNPEEVIGTLAIRFGRPDSIAISEIDSLRALPRLNESPRDICIFASKIANVVATLKTLNCIYYLYNPEVAKQMLDKLTPTLRFRYFDFAATRPKEEPDLIKFEMFIKREADVCARYAAPEQVPAYDGNARKPQRINTVIEERKCYVCGQTGHAIYDCDRFKKSDQNTRWDIAKEKKLCFRCLRYRNRNHSCKKRPCGVDGCNYFHHKLLHFTRGKSSEQKPAEVINSAWTAARTQSFLKIIPVRISGPAGATDTYALMDDGSTVTLVDETIATEIGATGPIDPLHIEAINDLKTTENNSRRVKLTLEGSNNSQQKITARTVKNLQVAPQAISIEQLERCNHLQDIKHLLSYHTVKPRVLIGQDNWHLLLTTTVRRGRRDQPVASLTPLGWVLHGSQSRTLGRSVNFVNHMVEQPVEDSIDQQLKEYFNMDALCITPKRPQSDPEQRALDILQKNTVKLTDTDRYQTSLLWKTENVQLPNNYESSLRRLAGIEKKLDRDQKLKEKYTQQMDALIIKGYAEPAPIQKTENRTWYLPHFGVVNPMKPDKLRVVHDAAAKTRGISLNDMLLKGPDLLQSLPGVIMRFRQHKIAVTADIAEMFMQVKLREEDRDALRYLWRGDRRDDQLPNEYRMTSLIFGAASSPSTAIFVKDLNAKQHQKTHPEAAAAIIEKHYVDDYLDSFTNIEDAARITKEVRDIHKRAGFELKQWVSNSPQLLTMLGENSQESATQLYNDKTERVLGLIWKPTTDELTFNLDLARLPASFLDNKKPTKREALKIVMSLFDPLGFAAPVTIRAKQILQEVWRRGTEWDSDIDDDLALQWKNWMEHLHSLRDITLPRCYLGYSDSDELQLHVFADASELAYAAAVYWRARSPNGDISVSLVVAKAKVAPLKLTSIPRLELQAAVMGTRLAETAIAEHERIPASKTFWTDSRTTLTWIKTGARSYKPYVAHRIAAIEENSSAKEWHWLPTKLNVADDATRDVPASLDRWYRGPEFLYTDEDTWPTQPTEKIEETGEERTTHITIENRKASLSEALPDISRFSKWERLIRSTARVLQFVEILQRRTERVNYKRTKKGTEADPAWRRHPQRQKRQYKTVAFKTIENRKYLPLTSDLLARAEELLVRLSQHETFAEEIEDMKKHQKISSKSRLRKLSIELRNDIVVIKSRIEAAEGITERQKWPPVIDGNHAAVRLYIDFVHRQLHHAGVETTINECRNQYWILRVRPVTRHVIHQCYKCRIGREKPSEPPTGNLPGCRLAHHQRPFTFTGVDYFGPLTVTVGRTQQKRYVALFTCLTSRAVHLEMAASLSAESAIMALRRMIARRGCPTEIWSDNGTNFHRANRELLEAVEEEANQRRINWRFIPAGAPFMGGAWERLVRSVKNSLNAVLIDRKPSEEVLTTLLAEVEFTVNSRPLTHVPVDPSDPEPLTPNHFLLHGPARVPVPGQFNDKDLIGKTEWRAAQRLADMFWARWVQEYLPELQNRREPHGHGPAISVGDLVQVVDPNLPRNTWVRGRVIATFPGPDNVVRTVDLLTKGGVLRRPVKRIIPLHIRAETPSTETPSADTASIKTSNNVPAPPE